MVLVKSYKVKGCVRHDDGGMATVIVMVMVIVMIVTFYLS